MPNLTNYAISGQLNMFFRSNTNNFAIPSRWGLALCRNVPSKSDTGATLPELPFSNGYGRVDLGAPSNSTWKEVIFTPENSGLIDNTSVLSFGPATADWGYVSGAALCDSFGVGSGNPWFVGAIRTPRDIKEGDTFQISIGDLDILLG